MITTAFFNLAFFLANTFISIFPEGTGFPSSFHTAAQSIGSYVSAINGLVPISVLGTCLGLILTVELGIFGFKTFKWIVSHLPQIGGRG